ncbi:putative ribonuclease H-like domain-containing protein [Tanacetum coccineum]
MRWRERFDSIRIGLKSFRRSRRRVIGHPQNEDQGYVDSGCSRHMKGTCPISQTSRNLMEDMLPLEEEPKEGKLLVKELLKLFKNRVMSEFYEKKGIKKEFSVARTPQQNGVVEIRNKTLIEAARTMLADSKLPTTFWAKAVNNACYVQNRVLVVKPHNKTPYELFRGRTHALSFMRPFGCHVTILNTLDYLGKFDGKFDEGLFVGYSMNSKAFRVYNIRKRKVEENLHIRFLEDKPIIASDGPKWLFNIDVLIKSMNYVLVVAGINSNNFVGTEESIGTGHSSKETRSSQDYILMPLWKDGSLFDSSSKNASNDEPQPSSDAGKKDDDGVRKESGIDDQERPENSTQNVNTARPSFNTASTNVNTGSLNINTISSIVTTALLEATHADFFSDETEMDMSNITTTYLVPSTLNTRIHKDHSLDHMIGDVHSGVQTRRMTMTTNEQGFISAVYEGKTHKDLHTCLFAYFLSQEEHKRIAKALTIGTKWVFRNKKDETGIVIQNKARLVAQGHTQEEGIHYDEVFAAVSAFLYGRIEEELQEPADILKKFSFTDVRTASTLMDTEKPLLKDSDGDDVDVHLYRSMIGSLMYLTSSRPDIKYLKGQPKLGIWYPRDSSFDLVAYSDSDYAGASLDKKSTTEGCQFLGCRLISWQWKKQTVVATSSTEAEYVAAASCCRQVLWIQNQMLDYGISKAEWLDLVIPIVEFVREKVSLKEMRENKNR